MKKQFTVIATTPKFNRHAVTVLAPDGSGYQLIKNGDPPKQGDVLTFNCTGATLAIPQFSEYGCPAKLPAVSSSLANRLLAALTPVPQ